LELKRDRSVARAALLLASLLIALGGCGDSGGVDATPERQDGTSSHEFEQEDIDTANEASDAVQEYCSGAVSEAQRVGCESHVSDEDLP
jgi:hypothetical protein